MPEPAGPDWLDELRAGTTDGPEPTLRELGPPGYRPALAVRWSVGPVAGHEVVLVRWDFTVHGGSFGEADATALGDAVGAAVERGLPLVTVLRSGGTRLQEGMAALVGIPRARLALRRLAAARLPHLAVCDQPTTGGVWIGIGSQADLRVAVTGAVVGFGGPRVVEAVTGHPVGPDSHTAVSAAAAGLVDAVLDPAEVGPWITRVLDALHPGDALTVEPAAGPTVEPAAGPTVEPAAGPEVAPVAGDVQVARARAPRAGGAALLGRLLTGPVPLSAPRADASVVALLGRLQGRPCVAVALAAEQGGRPGPDGYRLLARAARLAGRLGVALVVLVDTPGAEPGPAAEADGIAPAIAEAMDALLDCPSPCVSVVHGEGGSGGALAAAVADVVLVTPDAYFAALGPEGAAAALRVPPERALADALVSPHHLLACGFADAVVPAAAEGLGPAVLSALARAEVTDAQRRVALRHSRWSAPLR